MYHPDYLMQLCHISDQAVKELEPTFETLPTTPYADGQYRLRRYSIVRCHDGAVRQRPHHTFMQTESINHHQGGIVRDFEELPDSVISSEGLYELCQLFKDNNELEDHQDIEIHQMRVITLDDVTPVSPEGVHQDGFDHIAIAAIGRDNVQGGEILVYKDKSEQPFFSLAMNEGEVALLDDHAVWHNANPIRALNPNEKGHIDLFVLTAREH
ncbi:2OG-Fe dioxygenase family protein [Enterovibrio sp. ZSDZ35]|uniref:2OG-Fe dioxygenase family protein n=1 Tax=Enterovibrio qingdaonensis TaxID=2899818 RepID=A0ABT5QQM6_9GAMM|nr:2OG-Fe dioxygenase family protein [Enterovibrio sp. ZSDZ35]MDD1782805.1 2OG-Fe dioxygenase family protein [Enterovibrio sp. ZSDZ35]